MTFFFVLNKQELQHLTRNLECVFQYLPKIECVVNTLGCELSVIGKFCRYPQVLLSEMTRL